MANLASVNLTVRGRVQGVSFRYFAQKQAYLLGLRGWVRNLSEGDAVQIVAEGEKEDLHKLVELLKIGPPGARVEKSNESWGEYSGAYSGFQIKF